MLTTIYLILTAIFTIIYTVEYFLIFNKPYRPHQIFMIIAAIIILWPVKMISDLFR
jgi:hypothetical protein